MAEAERLEEDELLRQGRIDLTRIKLLIVLEKAIKEAIDAEKEGLSPCRQGRGSGQD